MHAKASEINRQTSRLALNGQRNLSGPDILLFLQAAASKNQQCRSCDVIQDVYRLVLCVFNYGIIIVKR